MAQVGGLIWRALPIAEGVMMMGVIVGMVGWGGKLNPTHDRKVGAYFEFGFLALGLACRAVIRQLPGANVMGRLVRSASIAFCFLVLRSLFCSSSVGQSGQAHVARRTPDETSFLLHIANLNRAVRKFIYGCPWISIYYAFR